MLDFSCSALWNGKQMSYSKSKYLYPAGLEPANVAPTTGALDHSASLTDDVMCSKVLNNYVI